MIGMGSHGGAGTMNIIPKKLLERNSKNESTKDAPERRYEYF